MVRAGRALYWLAALWALATLGAGVVFLFSGMGVLAALAAAGAACGIWLGGRVVRYVLSAE